MKVEKVIKIKGFSLIVFYTPAKCWQYAIASENGSYQCEGIFYTSQAAEDQGRRQIQILLG